MFQVVSFMGSVSFRAEEIADGVLPQTHITANATVTRELGKLALASLGSKKAMSNLKRNGCFGGERLVNVSDPTFCGERLVNVSDPTFCANVSTPLFVFCGLVFLFAALRNPVHRLVVALIFAGPAAVAGYELVYGITRESVPSDIWRQLFCVIGGIFVGMSALVRLIGSPETPVRR
jgi:hypothetical protein